MKLTYSGRRALVTGGSSDLALTLAEKMIKNRLFPILTYRSETGLARIKQRLDLKEKEYQALFLNFSDLTSLKKAMGEIKIEPDFLVDLAQGDYSQLISSADISDIKNYFEENLIFRSELIKQISRMMLSKKKGRLIFLSSSAVVRHNPGQGFYAAAKLATEALYRNLGLELGSRGITTVSIRASYIDTGRGKQYFEKIKDLLLKKIPINRVLTRQEVAEVILFFMSDSASAFNATEVTMDGGMLAQK